MNYLQREIDSTYVRTLAVIAEAKRKAYRHGFIEGVATVLLVLALWAIAP